MFRQNERQYPHYQDNGDSCLAVVFGNAIDSQIFRQVRALDACLSERPLKGIIECVPTYCSLAIYYDPLLISRAALLEQLEALLCGLADSTEQRPRLLSIPVCYDRRVAPDLSYVAQHTKMSEQEVVKRHSAPTYTVYMLGFAPGFPYLGGMDPRLATPRRATPRRQVSAGAVGIAAQQTGIYSLDSPSGWQIIGRTPLKLFDAKRSQPFLLKSSDQVRFQPIDYARYQSLLASVQSRTKSSSAAQWQTGQACCLVESAGLLCTLQDAGRFGYRRYGVTPAGPMDHDAFELANLLVGNDEMAAGLEMTLIGPRLRFLRDLQIALSGADLSAELDGRPLAVGRPHNIRAGSTLSFGRADSGMRGYLAIAGGFSGERLMQSVATDLKTKIGGVAGRALQKGDRLYLAEKRITRSVQYYTECSTVNYPQQIELRVIAGPQAHLFTSQALKNFYSQLYEISDKVDRMGYQLKGAVIKARAVHDILSESIAFGSVQIPPSGQPIIMMADRQPTGGYAKIATVISADLAKLAQARPGNRLSFKKVSVSEAQRIYRQHQARKQGLLIKRSADASADYATRYYRVSLNGTVHHVTVKRLPEE